MQRACRTDECQRIAIPSDDVPSELIHEGMHHASHTIDEEAPETCVYEPGRVIKPIVMCAVTGKHKLAKRGDQRK